MELNRLAQEACDAEITRHQFSAPWRKSFIFSSTPGRVTHLTSGFAPQTKSDVCAILRGRDVPFKKWITHAHFPGSCTFPPHRQYQLAMHACSLPSHCQTLTNLHCVFEVVQKHQEQVLLNKRQLRLIKAWHGGNWRIGLQHVLETKKYIFILQLHVVYIYISLKMSYSRTTIGFFFMLNTSIANRNYMPYTWRTPYWGDYIVPFSVTN